MKRATIVLEDSVHKAAKIKAVMQDKSFIQYVADLVKQDVQKRSKHPPTKVCVYSKRKPINYRNSIDDYRGFRQFLQGGIARCRI